MFTLTTKYAIARYEDDTLEPFDCKDLRTSLSLIPVNNLRKKILAFPRVLQEGGVSYYDENGVKYSSNLATLVRAPKDLKGIYEISHGTRVIEDRAFYECEELAHVKIPLSVEEIGSHAFTDCTKIFDIQLFCKITQIKEGTFEGCTNLQQIYIPRTVTSIERDVFYDCKNLKKIVYGGTYKEWKAIEKSPLWDSHTSENYLIRCRDLAVLKYTEDRFGVKFQDRGRELKKAPQTLSGTYEIPWGTEVIRRFAFFENKDLKSITLPVTLTDLKAEAFYRCGIENIFYEGMIEQWREIKKINGWFSPPKEILIHCKDGDLLEKVGRPSLRDIRID